MAATAEHRELVANILQFRGSASVGVTGDAVATIAHVLSTEEGIKAEVVDNLSGFSNIPDSHFSCFLLNQALPTDENAICATVTSLAKMLNVEGHLLIREDLSSARWNLSQLTQILDACRTAGDAEGNCVKFDLVGAFPMSASIYGRLCWSDFLWILKRSVRPTVSTDVVLSFRDFLDKQQYSNYGILSYEWIFGHGFISPGGINQNREFIKQLHLRPGMVVLDVGSGIGGNSMQMTSEFGVHVIGADLSSNMINIATDRANKLRDPRVKFLIVDVCKYDFPASTFDVIYSRDCIIHIADKKELFARFLKWLKPNGRCLLTDYNVGEKEFTPTFKDYLQNRQYALWPIRKYAETLTSVGFADVQAVDITEQFEKTLQGEISAAEANKEAFCEKFSAEKYDHLMDGWKNKIKFIASGDHKWGLFKATKPNSH